MASLASVQRDSRREWMAAAEQQARYVTMASSHTRREAANATMPS